MSYSPRSPAMYVNFRKGKESGLVYAVLNCLAGSPKIQIYSIEHGHEETGLLSFLDYSVPATFNEYQPVLESLKALYEVEIDGLKAHLRCVKTIAELIKGAA